MNDIESRLVDAMRARADDVEPRDENGALNRISERVTMNRRRGLTVLGIAAALAIVVGAVALLQRNDKGQSVKISPTATTNPAVTSHTTPGSVIPTGTASPIWPFASSNERFMLPADAAKSFAVNYLGMTNARVGAECCAPDETTVEIFPNDHGNARTVVHVEPRPHGDQPSDWVVVGAEADQIVVDTPQPHDVLRPSMTVSGRSVAFEATLGVQLRQYDSTAPILSDIATGGATDMQPFTTTIAPPSTDRPLVLVVFEGDASGQGAMTKATVIPLDSAATSEPSQIVGWSNGDLELLDVAGQVQQNLASSPSPAMSAPTYAPTIGLVAVSDRDQNDPTCGRSTTIFRLDGGAPVKIGGADLPAFSPTGTFLAYVDCSDTVQVRNMTTGKEAAAYHKDPVAGIAWVRSDALVVNTSDGSLLSVPLGGDAAPAPPLGTGTLVAGRGRFGTVAFWDGTNISSLNPADGKAVTLVHPGAEPISLDADDSGRYLLWVDVNHDLWKWSGGDPVKVGTGFNSAAW